MKTLQHRATIVGSTLLLALAAGACAEPVGDASQALEHDQGNGNSQGPAHGLVCPPGARFSHWTATCGGQDRPTSAAIATGAVGNVVTMGGVNSNLLPCVRAAVCLPAHPLSLIFSDEPESPRVDGILYTDVVERGRTRVYVYHTNGGTQNRSFAVVAENVSRTRATVTLGARGFAGPSNSYVFTGKRALSRFMAPATPEELTLEPGQRVVLDRAMAATPVRTNFLINSIMDLEVDHPVRITVVTYAAGADPLNAAATLPVLPSSGVHDRGTFPDAERWFVLNSAFTGRGAARIRIGGGESDPALVGVDATSGAPATLKGNYGLVYRVMAPVGQLTTLGVVARGGAWGGAVDTEEAAAMELPRVANTVPASVSTVIAGRAQAGDLLDVSIASAGGSALPADLVFFPSN